MLDDINDNNDIDDNDDINDIDDIVPQFKSKQVSST